MDYLRILFIFLVSISDFNESMENLILISVFIMTISRIFNFLFNRNNNNSHIINSVNLIVFLLILTHFISLITNLSFDSMPFEPSLKFILYFVIFYEVISIEDISSKKNYILILLFIFSLFHLITVFNAESLRNNFLYADPNYLFFIYSLYLYLLTFCYRSSVSSFNKISSLLLSVVVFYLMLSTQSRGGIIAFGFAALYFIISIKRSVYFKITLIFIVSISTYLFSSYFELSEKILSRLSNQKFSDKGAQDSRIIEFNSALNTLLNNPEYILVGTGPNNYSDIKKKFISYDYKVSRVHNTTIGILFESGFLALLAYISLFYILFKYFKDPIERSFIVYAFVNSQSIFVISFIAFWILIAFLININKYKNERSDSLYMYR